MNRAAFHSARVQQEQALRGATQTKSGNGPTSPNQLQQFNSALKAQDTSFFDDVSTFFSRMNPMQLFSQENETNEKVEQWLRETRGTDDAAQVTVPVAMTPPVQDSIGVDGDTSDDSTDIYVATRRSANFNYEMNSDDNSSNDGL